MVHNYPDIDLVSDNYEHKNFVKFCRCILKIWSKTLILTSIMGRNSVLNLQKATTKIYNTNVDLVDDNVYTKFGLILSIRSQDKEQKPNSDVNKGSNPVANLRKTMIYITNADLDNDNENTKFGLILSIRSQDTE